MQIEMKWLFLSKRFEIPKEFVKRHRRFFSNEETVIRTVRKLLSSDNSSEATSGYEEFERRPDLGSLKVLFDTQARRLSKVETQRAVLRRKVYDVFMETRILAIRLAGTSAHLHSLGLIDTDERNRDLELVEKYLVQLKLTG
ncbi:MAG: hypothetical protein J7J80_03660 [Thermotogae bacterium]|nr:hypothetical protein [Thermotogota bacterium]